MIKVSVVILSYNRKEDLKESLIRIGKSLLTDVNLEIIVSDNGSTDGSAAMVRSEFPEVRLIELDQNIGVAAYNIAFEQATGKYIVILDDDSFPGPNAISRMVNVFENDETIGIVAFDVRNFYNYDKVSQTEVPATKSANQASYLMGFNGAGAGYRTSLFRQIGGYPDEFFLYWNEMDLSLRVLNAGYRIAEFPDIVSYHKYAPTNRSSERGPFYYTRNLYWIIWKFFPLGSLLYRSLKLIFLSIFHSMEQRTLVYIKATLSAFKGMFGLKRIRLKKSVRKGIRIPFKLPFIIFK